jgi:hypothetical protein
MGGKEDNPLNSGAIEVAREILHPAMPPAAAAIIAETDRRLNRPSETEEELRELIESNEAAEEGSARDTKD